MTMQKVAEALEEGLERYDASKWNHDDLAKAAREALDLLRSDAQGERGAIIDRVQAFELGFEWANHLRGTHYGDSRDIGRSLCSDLFEGLDLNLDALPSFDTADAGIVAAKAEIKRAIAAAPSTPPPSDWEAGAEAMREACAQAAVADTYLDIRFGEIAKRIRTLPIPRRP